MNLEAEIVSLIGEDGMVALAEAFAGTRLYIPNKMPEDHEISTAIGHRAAIILSKRYTPDTIQIPLARALRAKHYRAGGMTNARIAVRLGMGEKGVEKMFLRLRDRGEDPRQ